MFPSNTGKSFCSCWGNATAASLTQHKHTLSLTTLFNHIPRRSIAKPLVSAEPARESEVLCSLHFCLCHFPSPGVRSSGPYFLTLHRLKSVSTYSGNKYRTAPYFTQSAKKSEFFCRDSSSREQFRALFIKLLPGKVCFSPETTQV